MSKSYKFKVRVITKKHCNNNSNNISNKSSNNDINNKSFSFNMYNYRFPLVMQSSKEKLEKTLPFVLKEIPDIVNFADPRLRNPGKQPVIIDLRLGKSTGCEHDNKFEDYYIGLLGLLMHCVDDQKNAAWNVDDFQICHKEFKKCCKIVLRGLSLKMQCHNPQLLTNVLRMGIVLLAAILTTASPLAIGLIPGGRKQTRGTLLTVL